MSDYDFFQDYDTIQPNERVALGDKVYIFEEHVPTDGQMAGRPLGRYKVFEARDPDSIGKLTTFEAIAPIVSETEVGLPDPSTGEVPRTITTDIEIGSVEEIQ